MRIVVMSDSHGNAGAVSSVIEKNLGHADIFVHLGDGERETDGIMLRYPQIDLRRVAGNCDYNSMLPDYLVIAAGDVRVLCAHGHRMSVKYGTERIITEAKRKKCSVALFGHTHERYEAYEDGIYILNPGSCSCPRDGFRPSYGFVDITDKGIMTNIVDMY